MIKFMMVVWYDELIVESWKGCPVCPARSCGTSAVGKLPCWMPESCTLIVPSSGKFTKVPKAQV